MTFDKRIMYVAISLLAIILSACVPQGGGVPVTGETPAPSATAAVSAVVPPQAVLQAQQWLAAQLSAAVEQVQIVEVQQAEWTDSCLGLGRPDESCLQVITPGWRAVFELNGQRYEVRTDQTGSVIRLASPGGIPGAAGGETGLENTQWTLVSFGETPVAQGSEITLLLAAGQAGGSGGCNSYSGSYQVKGQSISFSVITSTKRACVDAPVTEQEGRYFQALESASEYFVEGDQLRITYDDGQGVLIFESTLPGGPVPTNTPGG
jgi:heat shock protein HslJ